MADPVPNYCMRYSAHLYPPPPNVFSPTCISPSPLLLETVPPSREVMCVKYSRAMCVKYNPHSPMKVDLMLPPPPPPNTQSHANASTMISNFHMYV